MIKELVADAKDVPSIRGYIKVGQGQTSFRWSHYSRGGGRIVIEHMGERDGHGKDLDLEVRPATFKLPRLQKYKAVVKVQHTMNAAEQRALAEKVEGLFAR